MEENKIELYRYFRKYFDFVKKKYFVKKNIFLDENIHEKMSLIRFLRFLAITMRIKSFIFFPYVNKLFSIQDSIKKEKNEKNSKINF